MGYHTIENTKPVYNIEQTPIARSFKTPVVFVDDPSEQQVFVEQYQPELMHLQRT